MLQLTVPKLSKPRFVAGVAVAIVLVIGLMITISQPKTAYVQKDNVSFSHRADYKARSILPPAENQRSISLLRLRASTPTRSLDLVKETGAIIGANVTKTNFLDYLDNSARKTLPVQYPKAFESFARDRIKVSGHDASRVSFKYKSDNDTAIYGKLFILPSGNDAYYLTMQSADQARLDSESRAVEASLSLR